MSSTATISGVVFNIMRYSVRDGPGIRTTVFLKGCPLHCRWCHNPESQARGPELLYRVERCLGCGACVAACAGNAISLRAGHVVPVGVCRRCGTCVEACPTGARDRIGRNMTVDEVVCEIEKDRVFYDESGGGVTFSGGEPLAQPAFLEALIAECQRRRIHVAVDTSGAAPRELALSIARQADLLLYDLKILDDARHRQYVGGSLAVILDNLAAIAALRRPLEVRVPIIPGVNDGRGDIQQMVELVRRLGLRRVRLLPYHHTGADKYRRMGMNYEMADMQAPTAEHMGEVAKQFADRGVAVKIGG